MSNKKVVIKPIFFLFLIAALLSGMSLNTFAAGTNSYNRVDVQGNNTALQLSREMYRAVTELSAKTLGLEKRLDGITDIYCCNDGTTLLLCGNESRLVRISADYSKAEEVLVVDENNTGINFKGAKGIYSDENGDIYLADTANSRIIVLDGSGKQKYILSKPESDLIPEDFLYQPVCVRKDKHGYTYILSLGCYYGAILYSPENKFLGFYGSNTVEASALNTLSYIWDKLTGTDIKRSQSIKKLPYSFVGFAFDSEGYMVTCTGVTQALNNDKGQIRKISPSGSNILYKRNLRGGSTSSSSVNFLEDELVLRKDRTGAYVPQTIVSIDVSDDDFIFFLDSTHGTIYIYDSECNMLSAFGGGIGKGDQLGTFKNAITLALNGSDLLVADADGYSITVFEQTEYGKTVFKAQSQYLRGDYEDAMPLWEQVLSMDSNSQLAYRGLAMAYYNNGEFQKALNSAKTAVDYTVYDLAWRAILSRRLSDNFGWVVLTVALIAGAVAAAAVYVKKKKLYLKLNPEIKLVLEAPFHPFRSFDDLKYKKMGSLKIAVALTVLFYISSVLKATKSGFLYTDLRIGDYNSLYTLGSTIGLILLWSVCNFLISSTFEGKGTLKEVYIATTYTLAPYILFTLIRTLLSNFLPISASGVLNGIETALVIYVFFMLCIAMITVHEFDFFKFIATGIVVVFAMMLMVFIIFMCSILLKQFGSFLYSIYEETAYR